jgi:hypothetical protein
MINTPRRTRFHSARLVRTLAGMDALAPAQAVEDLSAKLGAWISFTDAIALSRLQNPIDAPSAAQPNSTSSQAIAQEIAKARLVMEAAIQDVGPGGSTARRRTRIVLPTPEPGTSLEEASTYTPYRRYHQAHQRSLEQGVQALRRTVRGTLQGASPALRQLAQLDAAFEEALQEREASYLATIPTLLERRFHHLRKAHQQQLAVEDLTDSTQRWLQSGGWLNLFYQDLQTVLLDELDMRLQPTLGMLDALNTETR